uniref:Uncharacterized protein n=1 Tax=Oryza meridionalis TaxID=40149 RepID=A0A0E0CK29_9ORYZ
MAGELAGLPSMAAVHRREKPLGREIKRDGSASVLRLGEEQAAVGWMRKTTSGWTSWAAGGGGMNLGPRERKGRLRRGGCGPRGREA